MGLSGLPSPNGEGVEVGQIDGDNRALNLTLEHLEQLNDCRFQLSATETTAYVRFNLLCKQVVKSPLEAVFSGPFENPTELSSLKNLCLKPKRRCV